MHCLRKPKGVTARARARKKRKDDAYALTIDKLVEARDGHCRYGFDVHPSNRSQCSPFSQWAHWGPWKRFKTRGRPPEQRHCVEGSLMLCDKHHAMYDAGTLSITAHTDQFCVGGLDYREEERTREIE